MAERLADVIAQIDNVRQLQAIVGAMRGIAASRALQSRDLVTGIRAHSAVISAAISEALSLLPPVERAALPEDGSITILFCAEQGFAGAFSERVLDALGPGDAERSIFLLGTRGHSIALERGIAPVWWAPMATHGGMVETLANTVSDALYDRVASHGVTRAEIVFPVSEPGHIRVERRTLLPVDMARFPRANPSLPPLVTLPPDVLLQRLAAEYVFVQICEAAMSAFAAENEARILAMSSARASIDRTLGGLQQREREVRQQEITGEVVELSAGTEASRERQAI